MLSLARFIEEVRVLSPGGKASRVQRMPDGRTVLAVRVMEDGRAGDVYILGPRTLAHFKTASGVRRAIMIQFKPGWSTPLLGVAASALTDRYVPLEEIWGSAAEGLSADLIGARSAPELIERVTRAIAARTDQAFEPASARLARAAVRLIEGGEGRVEGVAQRLGVTGRHLRRAFLEHVGVGPKDFVRSARLGRAVEMAKTSQDWSRIARDAGYYDQAHLIGDFRELVGLTPGAFQRRLNDRSLPEMAVAESFVASSAPPLTPRPHRSSPSGAPVALH